MSPKRPRKHHHPNGGRSSKSTSPMKNHSATTTSSSPTSSPSDRPVLSPFLVGFAAALLLIFIPILSTFYWVCHDVENIPIDKYSQHCPAKLIRKSKSNTNSKKGFWRHLFSPSKEDDDGDEEYFVVLPTRVETTCQSIRSIWSILTTKSDETSSSSTITCSPTIIERRSNDDDEDDGDEDEDEMTRGIHDIGRNDDEFQTAFTTEYIELSNEQRKLLTQFQDRVHSQIPKVKTRMSNVPWNGHGGLAWYSSAKPSGKSELERIDGGLLLYSYLRIMKWPSDLITYFPFQLCAKGCSAERALEHTLEFREKFQPWHVSPSTIQENSNGNVYHHGFSPPYNNDENGSHSLVWIRPGQRNKVDDIYATRAYVNVLERAVAASLQHSNGRVGKFNVILDGQGFSWNLMPSIHQLKVFITILQDHFPDRLGIVLLSNLGRIGEFVVNIIKPLISEEVRQKLKILPRDLKQRRVMLQTIVGPKYIPTWLGGKDSFVFDVDTYYSQTKVLSDTEAVDYVQSMPYHS